MTNCVTNGLLLETSLKMNLCQEGNFIWSIVKKEQSKNRGERVNPRRMLGWQKKILPLSCRRHWKRPSGGLKRTELPSFHPPLSRAQPKHTNKALTSLSSLIYTSSMSMPIAPLFNNYTLYFSNKRNTTHTPFHPKKQIHSKKLVSIWNRLYQRSNLVVLFSKRD